MCNFESNIFPYRIIDKLYEELPATYSVDCNCINTLSRKCNYGMKIVSNQLFDIYNITHYVRVLRLQKILHFT